MLHIGAVGDWTKKLILELADCKKKILKVSEMQIGFDESDVFHSLLDLDDQVDVSERRVRFYPKVHVSRPISSAAESAAYRKNFIMVGSGSGIAPFLSFLEDQADLSENYLRDDHKATIFT